MMVFSSLAEAIRAGFQIYDRNSEGDIIRMQKGRAMGHGAREA